VFVQLALTHGLGKKRRIVSDKDFVLYQKVHSEIPNHWHSFSIETVRICGPDNSHRDTRNIKDIALPTYTKFIGGRIQCLGRSRFARNHYRVGNILNLRNCFRMFSTTSLGHNWKMCKSGKDQCEVICRNFF